MIERIIRVEDPTAPSAPDNHDETTPKAEKSTLPMKMKMTFMLALAVGTNLLPAGDLRVYLHQSETGKQKRTSHPVATGARPYDPLIEQFNQPWPFGQESNQN